jgi:hypothetical protein
MINTGTLTLSEFELNQAGVIKTIAFLEARLQATRIANDSPKADPLLRGRIAELKHLLKVLKTTTSIAVDTYKVIV